MTDTAALTVPAVERYQWALVKRTLAIVASMNAPTRAEFARRFDEHL
jgi:hypothetical protein